MELLLLLLVLAARACLQACRGLHSKGVDVGLRVGAARLADGEALLLVLLLAVMQGAAGTQVARTAGNATLPLLRGWCTRGAC